MKFFFCLLILSVSFTIVGCFNSYSSLKNVDVKQFNLIVESSKLTKEEWVENPISIVNIYFPEKETLMVNILSIEKELKTIE